MKKLFALSMLLLTAALFFTGCTNNSNSGSDEEVLPGHWTTAPKFYEAYDGNGWKYNKNTTKYVCTDPKALNIGEKMVLSKWLPVSSDTLFGVHVKIKQEKFTEAECGIRLFSTGDSQNNTDAYYQLTFYRGSYTLMEKLSGQDAKCLSGDDKYKNTWEDEIAEEGEENDVYLYSDGQNLVLKVNGTELKVVERKLNTGLCSSYMYIPYDVSGAINVEWDYEDFQTAL